MLLSFIVISKTFNHFSLWLTYVFLISGVLYDKDRLPECLGNRATSFDLTKFRYMCIMAGCDYLESLPGIGLGKALKFWGKVTQPSLELALLKIPAYLNMPKLKISEEYIKGFIQGSQFIQNYKINILPPSKVR